MRLSVIRNQRAIRNKRIIIGVICVISLTLVCALIFLLVNISNSYFGGVSKRPQISKHESKPITKEEPIVKKPDPPKVETPVVTPPFVPDYSIPPIVDGMAPVITNFRTEQKVVYLTIDDGAFKNQLVVDIIKKNNIKASLFLTRASIGDNPDFFKQLTDLGMVIENHTLSHDINMVKNQTYEQQKAEICGMADYELQHYGYRPTLYRPPGGAYSNIMRQAAADCGMKAVVTWIAKANGGSMQYQVGSSLRPGDIVLMHFRPEFANDMQAFVDAMTAAGLHTELLEDVAGVR